MSIRNEFALSDRLQGGFTLLSRPSEGNSLLRSAQHPLQDVLLGDEMLVEGADDVQFDDHHDRVPTQRLDLVHMTRLAIVLAAWLTTTEAAAHHTSTWNCKWLRSFNFNYDDVILKGDKTILEGTAMVKGYAPRTTDYIDNLVSEVWITKGRGRTTIAVQENGEGLVTKTEGLKSIILCIRP